MKQNRACRSGIIKDPERRVEPGGPNIIPRSQQVKEGDRKTTEKDEITDQRLERCDHYF